MNDLRQLTDQPEPTDLEREIWRLEAEVDRYQSLFYIALAAHGMIAGVVAWNFIWEWLQ